MKSMQVYLEDLRKHLAKLNLPYQDELMVEIRHHIEDGLLDSKNGHNPEERMAKVMKEMGSSEEMAQGLYDSHNRHTWVDVLLAVVPLLAAMIVGRIFMGVPFSPTKYFESGAVYSVFYFLVCYGMIWLSIRRKHPMLELWWLSWSLIIFADILYGQIILVKPFFANTPYGHILIPQSWPLLLLFSAGILAAGIFAVQRLWRGRMHGSLILIFFIPWIFIALTKGINMMEGAINPLYSYQYYQDFLLYDPNSSLQWWLVIRVPIYLLLAAGIMLISNRQKRWLMVGALSAVYIIGTLAMLEMSLPTMAVFSVTVAALLAVCMWLDFKKSTVPQV